ncbi:MAG: DUF1573 domain-containing protein [Bacteroidales bacterium]|nr:DUF1573 domain-containing protein [Bacteroidales bacterium]MCF8337513.1 DUF1573 domain-containing protein [Bacteroidales bacterium]
MKPITVLFVALLFSFNVMAQDSNANAPEITFDESVVTDNGSIVYNYGKIYRNSDGTCQFTFTNTGKEPLVLSKVRSSCGCTVPEWPRKPILPGKKETIDVEYDTKKPGRFHKTITIYSNAEKSPIVARIKGKVLKKEERSIPEKSNEKGATPSADGN